MSRNGKSPKANKRNISGPTEWSFSVINLTEADKQHFRELQAEDASEFDDMLVQMLEGEYKLSVVRDGRNDCYIATLTARHEQDDNYGYSLSSRSPDPWEAIRLTVFKHMYCCKDGVWPKEAPSNNFG